MAPTVVRITFCGARSFVINSFHELHTGGVKVTLQNRRQHMTFSSEEAQHFKYLNYGTELSVTMWSDERLEELWRLFRIDRGEDGHLPGGSGANSK